MVVVGKLALLLFRSRFDSKLAVGSELTFQKPHLDPAVRIVGDPPPRFNVVVRHGKDELFSYYRGIPCCVFVIFQLKNRKKVKHPLKTAIESFVPRTPVHAGTKITLKPTYSCRLSAISG